MSLVPIVKDLSQFNTMALPCEARQFYLLENDDEVSAFFSLERGKVLVLGGGSNLILPPSIDYPVVQLGHHSTQIVEQTEASVVIKVGTAVVWDELVAWAVEKGFGGLENLSLIPGSVGAAPVQNIGAYGVELKDTLVSVRAYDRKMGSFVELKNADCDFAYRDSVFKRETGRFVITEVVLQLSRHRNFVLNYGELKALSAQADLSLQTVRNKVIAVRSAKLPDPKSIPNTGSFFKNPIVSEQKAERLKSKFPDLVYYPVAGDKVKLAAGWLIDKAGLRGYQLGEARVHDKQALVLTNAGEADQTAILNLARHVQDMVRWTYQVELEIEPVVIQECKP